MEKRHFFTWKLDRYAVGSWTAALLEDGSIDFLSDCTCILVARKEHTLLSACRRLFVGLLTVCRRATVGRLSGDRRELA